MRQPAGLVRFKRKGHHYRHVPFVMGGSVRFEEGEWLDSIVFDRPCKVSRDGLLLYYVVAAPTLWQADPLSVMGGTLRFNRIGR